MTAGDAAVGTASISKVKAKNGDRWYAGDPPSWEIDRPQPVLVELAGQGARFQIGGALRLDRLDDTFDMVIDSGMFQTFDADERSLHASSRVSEQEIRTTFTRGWVVEELRECVRLRRPSLASAWLATIRRTCLCSDHDRQP